MKINYAVAVVIFVILLTSIRVGAEEAKPDAPKNVFHFSYRPDSSVSDDPPLEAEVIGDNCKDLRAIIYSVKRKDKPYFRGKLYCIPNLEGITDFFKKESPSVQWGKISFRNGPILLGGRSEVNFVTNEILEVPPPLPIIGHPELPKNVKWVSENYVEVERIFECSDRKSEFCAKINVFKFLRFSKIPIYKLSETEGGDYRIFCWECEKIRSSPEALLNALLYRNALYGGDGFLLEEGHALRERTLEPEVMKKGFIERVLQGYGAPDYVVYESYALKHLRHLISLSEKEKNHAK